MEDYEELVRRGVLLQINWLSIIGYYSPQIMNKKLKHLIAADMVSFMGSDCHNMNHAELYRKMPDSKSLA